MKTAKRILKWIAILLLLVVTGVVVTGAVLYNKKYDAPYPDIKASADPAVIAHGKHLANAAAHCAQCHFKPGPDSLKSLNGEEFPLAGGGLPFHFPGGTFYSANISSDNETGIGKLTDGEVARVLRHGVKHDGKALIPIMEFQNLSEEDVTAIISYLRSLPPVSHKVPANDYNLLGKGILAFFLRPESPKKTPPVSVPADTTVEYGSYLANSVANCYSCHTQRNMSTGEYIGEDWAGGIADELSDGRLLIAPNLTPDPQSGHLSNWTFELFKARFSKGRLIPESIMPWGQFKNLNETELLAIWKYLHSIKPVYKKNGPVIQQAKS